MMRRWDVFLLGQWVFDVQGATRKVAMGKALEYLDLNHQDGVDVRCVE